MIERVEMQLNLKRLMRKEAPKGIADPSKEVAKLRKKLLRKQKELYAAQSDAEVTKAEKEIADLEACNL